MPITTLTPITLPERTFDKLWVSGIEISAPSPKGECNARIAMLPCDINGDVSRDNLIRMEVRDIIKKSQDKTSNIAKAMYFLLKAIEEEYILQNTPKVVE